MHVKLANAPVSWGVDYADDAKNPPWPKIMDEIAEAGYSYTELGPYGFYPTEPKRLASEFQSRGLTVEAGFVFQILHDPAKTDTVLDNAARTVQLLSAVGGRYLVTIDHISEERMATAGRRDLAKKLSESQFEHMIGLIDRIADIALAAGVKPVVHQHAGCYIEFEDEIEGVLQRLDPERVGICIDTGHTYYAGMDPVETLKTYADRLDYVHFKDIDEKVFRRVLGEKIRFFEACGQGVMCPIGRGIIDYPAVKQALEEIGYHGFITVEQERDPLSVAGSLADVKESRDYLRSVGF